MWHVPQIFTRNISWPQDKNNIHIKLTSTHVLRTTIIFTQIINFTCWFCEIYWMYLHNDKCVRSFKNFLTTNLNELSKPNILRPNTFIINLWFRRDQHWRIILTKLQAPASHYSWSELPVFSIRCCIIGRQKNTAGTCNAKFQNINSNITYLYVSINVAAAALDSNWLKRRFCMNLKYFSTF